MTNLSGANLHNGAAVGPQGEGRDSPSNFPTYPAYKDSGVEWLGEVPEHWSVLPVKLIGWLKGGAGFPHDKQGFDSHELDFHKVNALASADGQGVLRPSENTVSRETAKELGAYVFPKGTIVFAKVGAALLLGRLRTISAESCIDNNMMGFIAAQEKVSKQFALYSMGTIRFDLIANPGAVPSLNGGQIGNYRLAIPCLSEQIQITRFLDHETARIDVLIEEQQRLIELLKEKRQAVISHAVTKGLDPTAPMKDSGVEWLGEVPAHWLVTKLSFITSRIGSGKTPSGGADAYVDDGVTFIRSQNVYDEGLRLDDCVFIDEETDSEMAWSRVQPLDVLINITGASIGRTCIFPENIGKANVNQHVCVIRLSSPKNNAEWVSEALKATPTKNQVDISQTGAAREGLNFEQLAGFWICVPPLDEMVPILEYIRKKRALIEQLVNEAEASINLLQERRSALISAAVTGKIDVRGWQPPASASPQQCEALEARAKPALTTCMEE